MHVIWMDDDTHEGIQLELFVRSLAPRGSRDRQQQVFDRVRELVATGAIADYQVQVVGRRVPATPAETTTEVGTYLLNRIAVFEEWAHENDYSLASVFERRTVSSEFAGEHYRVVDLPMLALAEYERGDLRFVAPCGTDGGRISVADRLAELAVTVDEDRDDVDPLITARADPPEREPVKH